MSLTNKVSYLAGRLYIAEMPENIPTFTPGTNNKEVADWLDANLQQTHLMGIRNLQITKAIDATRVEINTDDEWTLMTLVRPDITVSFDYVADADAEWFSKVTGIPLQTVASTPTSVTQTLTWGTYANKVITLDGANADKTLVTITEIAAGVTTYTWNPNWFVWVNSAGQSQFVIPSADITTQSIDPAEDLDITYTYTPAVSKFGSITKEVLKLPKLCVIVKGKEDEDSNINTHYLVDANITGEWTLAFVDVVENGDVNPSSLSFMVNRSWYCIDWYGRDI